MKGSDPLGKGAHLYFNLGRYEEDGQRGSNRPLGAAVLGHRLPLQRRTSWLELRFEPPQGVKARVVRPNDART
jgi:hypothetical protein